MNGMRNTFPIIYQTKISKQIAGNTDKHIVENRMISLVIQ